MGVVDIQIVYAIPQFGDFRDITIGAFSSINWFLVGNGLENHVTEIPFRMG